MCVSFVLMGVVTQLDPLGPRGMWLRLIHGGITVSAIVIGLCWVILPWPSRRTAIAFVVWADAALAIGASAFSHPDARIGATVYMGLVGLFIAFLLGRTVLVVHCVFATVVVGVFAALSLNSGATTPSELFMHGAPALASVVLMPIVTHAVIEGGRDSILAAAVAADRDPLTGLLNRRGMATAMELMHRDRIDAVDIVVVLMDVDRLKELNDTRGHDAGDATLKAVADMLRANVRIGEIAARIGGDEFLVVAFPGRGENIDSTIRRVSTPRPGIDSWSVSVGAAWQSATERKVDVESLARQADYSLYKAKSTRGALQHDY
ncbi:GGDEF domain-containing protein [Mycobacterium sp. CBMA271]|nr:GGDEF domain-containing protein [Mycobacteroides sp. CBMA 271]